jgi:hypothetical protein
MTYQDPKVPDSELRRNPRRYPDLNSDAFGTGSIIALILGIALIGGVILYGVSGLSTTANNIPPSTTGQGGAPINQPAAPPEVAPPAPKEPRIDN